MTSTKSLKRIHNSIYLKLSDNEIYLQCKKYLILDFLEFPGAQEKLANLKSIADERNATIFPKAIVDSNHIISQLSYNKELKNLTSVLRIDFLSSEELTELLKSRLNIDKLEYLENKDIYGVMKIPRQTTAVISVNGESMKDAGINDGDTAVLDIDCMAKDGDIVAVLIESEPFIKRIRFKKGKIELHSANPDFKPVSFEYKDYDFSIIGVVKYVIRRMNC